MICGNSIFVVRNVMPDIINIYCDESCHLERDNHESMVIGAVWCELEECKKAAKRMREIKALHGIKSDFETKWTKVSYSKLNYYKAILDYFFDNSKLHFRGLIVPDKSILNHEQFNQTHDDWYYKMFFELLKAIIDNEHSYRIYLDYKDSHSKSKTKKLHNVLSNANYDFSMNIIERIQTIRSHESELLQLSDLLIGAVSYECRGLSGNAGKEALVSRMKTRSGLSLTRSTLLSEKKVNLFRWMPQGACRE